MSSQYYFNTNDSRSYYSSPQQYQSTSNFNRNPPVQSSTPQVRACVRVLGSQDQYPLTSSPQLVQITPQQHHFQFDSRQPTGRPTGPAVVYQTPGAAQFTHRNVDLWTEGQGSPSPRQDHYVQAQRVSVRSVSTGSPQQSHSISPQRHQDHLQQYYNQLTPDQHQQLFRQQQQQNSFEQRLPTQQVSPSTAAYNGGQGQVRRNEQFYPSQQEEQDHHPVGIRNLMTRFDSPSPRPPSQPRSRSTSTRNYSTSTRSYTTNSMTYSALPKAHEPPVNSLEYYQMLQQVGVPFNNLQQAVAPAHIQHVPTPRDRLKTGSLSEPPPAHASGGPGNSLSSIRNQYINQAREATQSHLPPPAVQQIPRTIVGEDYPPEKPAPAPAPQPTEDENQPADVEEGVSSF